MNITVPNNNLRSETQKRVMAAMVTKNQPQQKAYNFKWLLFPVACVVVSQVAGIAGTLSLYVF